MKHRFLRHFLHLSAASLVCAAFIGIQPPTLPASDGTKTEQGLETAEDIDGNDWLSGNKGSIGGEDADNEPSISPQNDKEEIADCNTQT